MAKKVYQATVGKESKTAKAMTTNANISLKYSTEICNQLKSKNVDKAIAWLTRIVNHEEYLPLKRYHRKVAHRKGDAKEGVKSGRYPEKTIASFLTLLNSAKSNADFKGLDDDKLTIIHAFASKGISRMTYQSKGKIGGKARRKNATHIEVIVSEVKA
ncbi:MAG: 50S ribosomal protein L22 [Candidatus Diapherotrites archaeon]|jgi:large subunit ribosomal protein L22|uniref:Large ribosomal subunit protein uL22 n=1 Tax=Candidatus Iainarchaeum sp. TaxID=3101447 RepID=A0A8T5GFN2_9ARCH|nr:50S ribosomal protein L22 [Candidatus Diapherotrites archaeon]MBT7241607.1 50S ribosomal protein L22 [Candidatus Diapherotrites archaeon]